MHLKRQKTPKNWPIPRKGTKYVVRPSSNLRKGIPVLIILRDMLGMAQNRKEVKKAIHLKQVLLNGKAVNDEKIPALLFDVITIASAKKYYRIDLSKKGDFKTEEINENESRYKTAKIVNKKILKGKKTQLNLSDGKNFISDLKCKVNDSVLINLEKTKIDKCLPLKEKAKVIVFLGKYAGELGIVSKIDSKNKIVELNIDDKKIKVLIKQLMVVE